MYKIVNSFIRLPIQTIFTRALFLFATFLFAPSLNAEPPPKWEIGASIGTVDLADYRGSKEYQSRTLLFPYLVYRSRLFSADRDGVRGLLFSSDQIELNVSGNASLATEADDNPLRSDMPAIDPTFEIGPSLDINLTSNNLREGWKLRLPLRSVFAFNNDGIDHVGWVFNPNINFRHTSAQQWHWSYTAGLYYANQPYHDYYYSVAPEFALAERPTYRANAGYSGFTNQIGVSRHWGNIWYGAYLRYDNLNRSEFLDSPLVETQDYFAAGIAMGWIFAHSSKPVSP